MSTPATLRELAREKAARPVRQNDNEQAPLSASSPRYNSDDRKKNTEFTSDRVAGRSYKSFEGGKKNGGPRSPPKPLTPPPVEDVPIDVDTDDYKVDAEKVVCFNGRQHFLSTLYPVTLTMEGHEYPSVEHYYQACKLYTLGGAQLAAQIRRVPSPGHVKVLAKKLLRQSNVSFEKIDEWKRTQGTLLLHHAIVHKFIQNADLREKLLKTGDAILAQTYDRDNVFATGCDREKMLEWCKANNGQIIKIPTKIDQDAIVYIPLVGEGKNVLGFINMKVRGQVKHFGDNKPSITDPIVLAAMQTVQLNDGPNKGEGDK